MTVDRFYFGCGPDDIGHYFWPREVERTPSICPWGYEVDGALQPKDKQQIQGRCAIHFKDGWTAIAWWDRSKDRRGASCSVFAMRGDHNFEHMLAAFRAAFPWAFERITFKARAFC